MNYIYRLYNSAGHLLYIGVTNQPNGRFAQHRAEKWWWPFVDRISIVAVSYDRQYAEREESAAIWKERPRFNIRGANWTIKDDQWEEVGYYSDIAVEQRAWDDLERQAEMVT